MTHIKILENENSDYIIYENSPIFFKQIYKELNLPFKFNSVKSYYFIKYKDNIKKKYFSDIVKNDKKILIVALKDWEEIADFKRYLNKSFNTQFLYSNKFYSDKKGEKYLFFKGDMIIFTKNIDPIFILKNLKKIPLTSPKEDKDNYGYIITENYKKFKDLFEVFNYLNFSGKVEYHFNHLDK